MCAQAVPGCAARARAQVSEPFGTCGPSPREQPHQVAKAANHLEWLACANKMRGCSWGPSRRHCFAQCAPRLTSPRVPALHISRRRTWWRQAARCKLVKGDCAGSRAQCARAGAALCTCSKLSSTILSDLLSCNRENHAAPAELGGEGSKGLSCALLSSGGVSPHVEHMDCWLTTAAGLCRCYKLWLSPTLVLHNTTCVGGRRGDAAHCHSTNRVGLASVQYGQDLPERGNHSYGTRIWVVGGSAGEPRCCIGMRLLPFPLVSYLLSHVQGIVQSAFLYGYMATQLLGGTLADRFGGEVAQVTFEACTSSDRCLTLGGPQERS